MLIRRELGHTCVVPASAIQTHVKRAVHQSTWSGLLRHSGSAPHALRLRGLDRFQRSFEPSCPRMARGCAGGSPRVAEGADDEPRRDRRGPIYHMPSSIITILNPWFTRQLATHCCIAPAAISTTLNPHGHLILSARNPLLREEHDEHHNYHSSPTHRS